jgi:TetR/AcrR family transcriptional regulator, transcriptional repressor for nem operon
MARTKEFDRDEALGRAMLLFWQRGYDGATTDDLLAAMGIGRQSLYDTFGDKQALFDEALRCYHQQQIGTLGERLKQVATPFETLTTFLDHFAYETEAERARGCMGINATTASGQRDPKVIALARDAATFFEGMLAQLVVAAQADGDIADTVDPKVAGRFLYTALQGLTIRAQAGATPDELRSTAEFAIKALSSMR